MLVAQEIKLKAKLQPALMPESIEQGDVLDEDGLEGY